jgi:hypothetical protein
MSRIAGPCTCGVVFDNPCPRHPRGKEPRERRRSQLTKETCPDAAKYHAPDEPSGYLPWHDWAEEKAKTHKQTRCPTCGLYTPPPDRSGRPCAFCGLGLVDGVCVACTDGWLTA